MGEKSGSGSGIRIQDEHPDHITESFDADPVPGWKKFGSGMGKNSDPGWGKIRIPDMG
jgi:hypothetical protein